MILREIFCAGRFIISHNDVENIQKAAERLAELVPEAWIANRLWADARART
ncbi:hypothetical protein ACNKHW_07045 [Shigella flexneri]